MRPLPPCAAVNQAGGDGGMWRKLESRSKKGYHVAGVPGPRPREDSGLH